MERSKPGQLVIVKPGEGLSVPHPAHDWNLPAARPDLITSNHAGTSGVLDPTLPLLGSGQQSDSHNSIFVCSRSGHICYTPQETRTHAHLIKMPARASAPPRDLDYTNVGKVGRRTGITLPPRRRDEHGLEEMTGLFSSPEKPASKDVQHSIEEREVGTPIPHRAQPQTPPTAASVRRSVRNSARPRRSASPRKSGISGTAKRSGAVDVLAASQDKQAETTLPEANEVTEETQESEDEVEPEVEVAQTKQIRVRDAPPTVTPARTTKAQAFTVRPATVRRFSPERTPLRNHVLKAKSAYIPRISDIQPAAEVAEADNVGADEEVTPTRANTTTQIENVAVDAQDNLEIDNDDDAVNERSLEDPVHDEQISEDSEEEMEPPPLPPIVDDEDEDQTFDPSMLAATKRGQNKANSRRKRKSDMIEEHRRLQSSPAAKRAKRRDDNLETRSPKETASRTSKAKISRPPLAKKDKNAQLSRRRQQELDDVVEKIRARPGLKKSLYVLRRETPTDDTMSRTRSGRVVVKPVAWWRNEGIEYDAGDGTGAGIGDGWKFPLRSIKEVIRREEKVPTPRVNKKKGSKKAQKRPTQQDAESDDGEYEDPDADDWELDSGTLTAPMGVWDPELQACADEEEDVDIAHAAEAIETREVKGQGFKYAKLISQTFFGVGIVDLPAGAMKRAKNSRKMHMSFFVFEGRVTVQTGPMQGPETRFSIGKGGFWHVPRGKFAVSKLWPR